MLELTGRAVLVPGASGGFGRAVAEMFGLAGASVMLGYHENRAGAEKLADSIRSNGGQAEARRLDATDASSIGDWVAAAADRFSRIDVLANCLGSDRRTASFTPFLQQDPDAWGPIIEIELMAGIRLARAVLPHMIERRWGRILILGSDSGKVGESGVHLNAAARGGCIAFAKALAREVGRHGVTVNTVCPGPTHTPLLDTLTAGSGQKLVDKMVAMTAMKRIGSPRDVAAMVVFLASDLAGYVTGQAISVSGGLTMC